MIATSLLPAPAAATDSSYCKQQYGDDAGGLAIGTVLVCIDNQDTGCDFGRTVYVITSDGHAARICAPGSTTDCASAFGAGYQGVGYKEPGYAGAYACSNGTSTYAGACARSNCVDKACDLGGGCVPEPQPIQPPTVDPNACERGTGVSVNGNDPVCVDTTYCAQTYGPGWVGVAGDCITLCNKDTIIQSRRVGVALNGNQCRYYP